MHSSCVVGVDGQIVALKPNPAVSTFNTGYIKV